MKEVRQPNPQNGRSDVKREKAVGDYWELSNEELQHMLSHKVPYMVAVPVDEGNRETIIAMLRITENR